MIYNELAKELFKKVESTQGYAFISDAIEGHDLSNDDVLAIATSSLVYTRLTVSILENFIRHHERKVS